ncbi:hypothetical protein [Vibrio sp. ER1A]|uniref:hypothetical protein n=1 Tax=Vibrio sp. ER1A TaxID=1517681 RepID=UPI0004DD863A|nr:hypothetical protein [Vibrio sp. ER1A]KFA95897.1 hypothetical protein HW45_23085 [Vibrio sp. ER1A]
MSKNSHKFLAVGTLVIGTLLSGCGGGDGGNSESSEQTKTRYDYPIKGANFVGTQSSKLRYEQSEGDEQLELLLSFTPVSRQEIESSFDSRYLRVVDALINNGVREFYKSSVESQQINANALYYVSDDGLVHEITELILSNKSSIIDVQRSMPLFNAKGSQVWANGAGTSSSESIQTKLSSLTGKEAKLLLSDFESSNSMPLISDTDNCDITWAETFTQYGDRREFVISSKKIEAASNTIIADIYLMCDQLPSSHKFTLDATRWFNPSLSILNEVTKITIDNGNLTTSSLNMVSIEN